jgi:lantibiotic modifying enzyme
MTDEAKSFLKKEISVGEVIGLMLMLVGLGLTFYVTTSVSQENHEYRIMQLEKDKDAYKLDKTEIRLEQKEGQRSNEERFNKIDDKLDDIIFNLNEMKVEMQNKQDKIK